MALANFSLPSAGVVTPTHAGVAPGPLKVQFDDLLYSPESHQPGDPVLDPAHEPFAPPASHKQERRSKLRKRAGTAYLPPHNQYTHYPRPDDIPRNPYANTLQPQVYQQPGRLDVQIENQRIHEIPQYDHSGQYVHDPAGDYDYEQRRLEQARGGYRSGFGDPPYLPATPTPPSSRRFDGQNHGGGYTYNVPAPTPPPAPQLPLLPQRPQLQQPTNPGGSNQRPPDRPAGFTKVETNAAGGKTQLHAVLDYDDDYYDDVPGPGAVQPAVTPLQGPILVKNGTVPVVPLTSYPTVNNGSLYQIPILWTALSVALGYELQGQIIRGVPCVKRNYQLYCPTAGNTYPLDKIENFIDENKALIKRMYGSFATVGGGRARRSPGPPPEPHAPGDSFFRHTRQAERGASPALPADVTGNSTGRVDACESKTEIITPYWALNSGKKLRAIVNTMHFEQAIHQEVCSKTTTARCSRDCGCEQKYKWHRLLAYDPGDDCAGIFMDWFLFPSCCVCRCQP